MKCQYCQKEFVCSKGMQNIQKYCSKKCGQDDWRTKNRERFNKLVRESPSTKRRLKWEREHPKIVNAKNRAWAKKNRERLRKREEKYRNSNREKINAKANAQRYIKIPKNQICVFCKKNKATEKHHPDYSKQLEVTLLCKKCHNKIHRENIVVKPSLVIKKPQGLVHHYGDLCCFSCGDRIGWNNKNGYCRECYLKRYFATKKGENAT